MLSRADADLSNERAGWRVSARSVPWLWRRLLPWRWLLLVLLGALPCPSAGADEPGLTIETGSPDALCPDLTTTRAAVERRLGQLVVPDGSAFTARYTIAHAPAGTPRDFVRLELFGPDRVVQLTRDLPLDGESCSTMADVIALVLDRHFRAVLGREPVEPAVPAVPAVDAAPPAALDTVDNQAAASSGPPVEVDAGDAPVVEPAAGDRSFSVELAFREPDRPALGGRALLGLWPHGLAGVALHVGLTQDHETVAGGEAASRELVTRGFLAWAPRSGRLRPYVGPGLRLSVARGTGRGLPTSESGVVLRPSFGLDTGVVWRSTGRWALSASAALDVMVPRMGGWFSVENDEVLAPAPVRIWLGVGVGYAP